MLILFETAAGFALLKVLNESKLAKVENIVAEFDTPSSIAKFITLQKFHKFGNTTEALDACTALVESKLGTALQKFLKTNVVQAGIKEQLAVAEPKLGGVIKEKLGINCVCNPAVLELTRCIRSQLSNLVSEVTPKDFGTMSLGLAHSYSRYKVKFSPEKVDTMIVQAVALLDDLDKEINVYSMRVREWYGWHFPEMSKLITDNLLYCKVVKKMGQRTNALATELSDLLPEELEAEIRETAQISMGTEVSQEDMDNISELCMQVIEITEYREQLWDYLTNRMQAIAPNLTALVGELVGARLIARTGSLISLAKYPASTIQILGAEKALFRALKSKKKTPKYGLLFQASLVGQTQPKNKGKVSRCLAAKAALCSRVDALGDAEKASIGISGRVHVEARLRGLDESLMQHPAAAKRVGKYDSRVGGIERQQESYNTEMDSTMSTTPRKRPATAPVSQSPASSADPKRRRTDQL
ncbi:nucleolar protein Nop58p [Pelomyxa schiedti]|nr:nucleolar protein Nop58p [Pelomyxa schiedti]